ncbi:MAG TPA: hypothetical protein VMW45_04370 [Dehalococcoidia bacterium]|nr:hypothetical protein [Dehalococcoidia bacterium]
MSNDLISAECICPAPMMSEIDRQKRVTDMRKSIYVNRCVIEKEWRVRNPVFDKKGEKSTTMFRIRPARTVDELEFIVKELEG